MKLNRAEEILSAVALTGVQEICICAGARNASFVFALERARGVKVYPFFEERSAAFFALGRAQATRKPVAIVTTSGTAAAELLPATIEAFYQGIPLLLITADRPKEYRGSGAPQSIEQVGLFSHYVTWSADVEGEAFDLEEWRQIGPAHLNVCLPDPEDEKKSDSWNWPNSLNCAVHFAEDDAGQSVKSFFSSVKRPLLLVSGVNNEVKMVESILDQLNWPIYAEGPSGVRESQKLKNKILRSGEKMVSELIQKKLIDGIIRIGSVPTLRAWRDLDEGAKKLPVLSFSAQPWSGLAREKKSALSLKKLEILMLFQANTSVSEEVFIRDRLVFDKLQVLFSQYPRAEVSLMRKLSHLCTDRVFVGNSLPIREWDLAAQHDRPVQVYGNRGANGIDGQISTFIGSECQWGVFGDLTALYDLASPWALKYAGGPKSIAVINNNGGQIFASKFSSNIFLNSHKMKFQKWAELWKLEYKLWQDIPSRDLVSDHQVVEIQPDKKQSDSFWLNYRKFFQ